MYIKLETKEDLEKVADMAFHYATIEWPHFWWKIEVVDDKNIKISCTVAVDTLDERSEECISEYNGEYAWYQLADQIRWDCFLTQETAIEKSVEKS